jgi:acyl-CoA-binding protein
MALLTTQQQQQQRRMWLAVTGGLVLTTIAALQLIIWHRRRRGRSRGDKHLPSDLVLNYDDEPDDELCLVFNEAAKLVRSWQHDGDAYNVKLDQRDRLMLYGLYKQAMVGNRNDSDAVKPSKLNIVEYAKFDAWGKFHGLPRSYAMEKYCEVVFHFSNGGTSSFVNENGESEHSIDGDVVYDDDDNEDANEGDDLDEDGCALDNKGGDDDSVACMGLRPSTLSGNIDITTTSQHEETDSSLTPEVRLRNAAMSNDIVALQTIINAKVCDINNADEDGQTALHFAVDRKSHDCITALIKAGANVNAVDRDGIGVLQTSLCAGLDIEYIKLLLDAGANPDACDDDGESPRTWVSEEGSLATVELFELYKTRDNTK